MNMVYHIRTGIAAGPESLTGIASLPAGAPLIHYNVALPGPGARLSPLRALSKAPVRIPRAWNFPQDSTIPGSRIPYFIRTGREKGRPETGGNRQRPRL